MPEKDPVQIRDFLKIVKGGKPDSNIHQLAFANAAQPSIITTAGDGKIIIANNAACKLLGYSQKEILTKSRSTIFNINDSSFKKMLKQRTKEGHSVAIVTAIKKSGAPVPCEITSAVFMDGDGIEKAITTIGDLRKSIERQNVTDTKNNKRVADDIKLAKSKQQKIDSKKNKVVLDNIVVAETHQKEIDIENEKKVGANIARAKLKQRNIDVKKDKTIARDIKRAQVKADARLAANSQWIKYIAKTSYDVMWDWDIITGEIYVGDSIEEVFGYAVKNNAASFKEFIRCLLPENKEAFEKKLAKKLASAVKSWNDSFMFIRRDGSVASVTGRASIIRDEQGKALHLIGNIQDISRLKQLESELIKKSAVPPSIADNDKLLSEYKESFKLLFNSSTDVLFDVDVAANSILLSNAYEKEFGYTITAGMTPADFWVAHLHPDDKQAILNDYDKMLASGKTEWTCSYRFIRADLSIANVVSNRFLLRNADGKVYRMLGAMRDISKQTNLEERLELEIRLKETEIAAATEDAKDSERSHIGKELHDNVNQLLAVSKMYLELAKGGGANSALHLNRSTEYTLEAIEEIRKLTKGLTKDTIIRIGLTEAIEKIVNDTMEVNSIKISFNQRSFNEKGLTDKFKLNIFRILQEALNNILKHANASTVGIILLQNKKSIQFIIADNGDGFDTSLQKTGIGVENIKNRALSFNGMADFVSEKGQGCVLTVTFPVTDAL